MQIFINRDDITELQKLESFQGHIIKSSLYLDKRSHHSDILYGLKIYKIENVLNQQRVNLLRRVFRAPKSSYSVLCTELMSKYAISRVLYPGTLVSNIALRGISPVAVAFSSNFTVDRPLLIEENGVRDSISHLLTQHIRPGNDTHFLLRNLTRSF